ncbi:ATP-dependent helicase, partial [Pseudomonas aeruginosa]|nr:ATP-dependent helicase [Pseudomonas aeruginosa]
MITKFPPQWQEKLDQVAFTHLTPIQEQAFQPIVDGKNFLGIS